MVTVTKRDEPLFFVENQMKAVLTESRALLATKLRELSGRSEWRQNEMAEVFTLCAAFGLDVPFYLAQHAEKWLVGPRVDAAQDFFHWMIKPPEGRPSPTLREDVAKPLFEAMADALEEIKDLRWRKEVAEMLDAAERLAKAKAT